MPRTAHQGNASLQINVAAPPTIGTKYVPGDTIIGTVVRRIPVVAPTSTVQISLFGRAKSKITIRRNNGQTTTTHHYRGRWALLGSEQTQILHQGPLHLALDGTGEISWPFSITIPTRTSPSVIQGHDQAESFIDLNTAAANLELPGDFQIDSQSSFHRKRSEAYVEYWLEATLSYSRGGSQENVKATYPLSLSSALPASEALSGPVVQKTKFQDTIRSLRLLPGMADVKLTFKQKSQQFFASSKVPKLAYQVTMHLPRSIQLDSLSPLPLTIQFSPVPELTSPNIQDTSQILRLNCIQLTLVSYTSVMAPASGFLGVKNHCDNRTHEEDLNLGRIFRNLKTPIVLDLADSDKVIDVAEKLELLLRSDGLYSRGQRLSMGGHIYPDFIVYNIRHTHSLKIDVWLTIAGEEQRRSFYMPLTILPPSRVESAPPEYTES